MALAESVPKVHNLAVLEAKERIKESKNRLRPVHLQGVAKHF